MSGESFRARALHESLRYGDDPYVFLRELAQNARDAHARAINVRVTASDDASRVVATLAFEDDGDGMSFAHAREYLFKLYASSKEQHDDSAGHYGVGFWSVLRWRPDELLIESRTAHEPGWAVTLSGDLQSAREVPCSLERPGTRVTLRRYDPPPEVEAEVIERLTYYCRYLRRRSRRPEPLPITFNGGVVTSTLTLDAPLTLSFTGPDVEGVVALADAPRVELYARGLLVMRATVLEELEGHVAVQPKAHAAGLAPVVILNSNSLDVVLSRQRPRAGKELTRLVKVARSRLDLLARRAIDGVVPRRWHERLADAAAALLRALGGDLAVAVLAAWLVVVVLGALAVAVAWNVGDVPEGAARPVIRVQEAAASTEPVLRDVPGAAAGRVGPWRAAPAPSVEVGAVVAATSSPSRALSNITGYGGPIVDVPDAQGTPWSLVYRTRERGRHRQLMFKALSLDHYDVQHGWTRRASGDVGVYPEHDCAQECVSVGLHMSVGEQPFVVPVPTGFRVIARSLTLDGQRASGLHINDLGEPLLVAAAGTSGLLQFDIAPVGEPIAPAVAPVGVAWPKAWREHVEVLRRIDKPHARARRAAELVLRSIAYDVTPAAAERFASTPGPWLDRVLTAGAGDCDVKNGVNVLLLREVGVPARLAIGIAAEQGVARPSLHAWTEYWALGRWWPIDATGQPAARAPVASAAPRAQPAVGVALARPDVRVAGPTEGASPPQAQLPAPTSPSASGSPAESSTSAVRVVSLAGAKEADEASGDSSFLVLAGPLAARPWLPAVPLAFVFLLAAARRRSTAQLAFDGDGPSRRDAVARMLRDMLTQPTSWRGAGSIWYRRVLPCLSGRPMSVDEALRRSRQGALFASRGHVPLATAAAAAGARVLDGADPAFGPTVLPLLRATDLDQIAPLLELAGRLPRHDPRLVAAQALLDRAGARVELRVCEVGSSDLVLREIDVSRLRLPDARGTPRRFVLLNAASPAVSQRLALLAREPRHGLFVLVDWLLERSDLLVEHGPRLRELAADLALGEEPGC